MTIPNLLTFIRIGLVPFLVLCFYISMPHANLWAGTIFIIASITDFLDGYLARAWKQHSVLGQLFDPIADKLLVAVTLLMLAGFQRLPSLHLIAAAIILSRELFVAGLREFLAEVQAPLPVSRMAKWKTGVQMTSLSLLLLQEIPGIPLPLDILGLIGLWLSAILTLRTGWDYFRLGIDYIHYKADQGERSCN